MPAGQPGDCFLKKLDIKINLLKIGPLEEDLLIGTKIAEEKIDILIFFRDPLEAPPHDPDVKALLRMAVVWNIPVETNRATAVFFHLHSWSNTISVLFRTIVPT